MAATLANVNRVRNTAAFKPTDFMPWHETPADDEAPQQAEDERDNLFRMMGG